MGCAEDAVEVDISGNVGDKDAAGGGVALVADVGEEGSSPAEGGLGHGVINDRAFAATLVGEL